MAEQSRHLEQACRRGPLRGVAGEAGGTLNSAFIGACAIKFFLLQLRAANEFLAGDIKHHAMGQCAHRGMHVRDYRPIGACGLIK
jgi:hypothetical protein